MAKKTDRPTVSRLMTAASDLSSFAMATATTSQSVPLILKPTANSSAAQSKWTVDPASNDKYNWLVHIMYARGDHDQIQELFKTQSRKNSYMNYVQALVLRQQGRVVESLDQFQQCVVENPSLTNIKQVGKTLALLGRYRTAIDAYREALTRTNNDWEIFHNLGMCFMQLREFAEAKENLLQALQVSEMQEASYLALGKIFLLEGSREEAENIFERGARKNPESPTLFTEIGLLAFQRGHYAKAFECFGTALTFCPTHIPAIMAACQVIQKHGDCDVALSKYRIVYGRKPECAQVWNNIGMCFFSKKKYVAAISCLKRANYLAPFELYILYNLGLVHLHLQQYASAAIFLQSAIRLNREHAASYALLVSLFFKDLFRDSTEIFHALTRSFYRIFSNFSANERLKLLNDLLFLERETKQKRLERKTTEKTNDTGDLSVSLARLNDYENANRAYTQSLKLDPTDPMTLLNFAILHMNLGSSESKIDQFLRKFHESFDERAASMNERELDRSMKDLANQIRPSLSSEKKNPPAELSPPVNVPTTRKTEDDDLQENASPRKAPEIAPVKTKIYDDGRSRTRKTRPTNVPPSSENGQNENIPTSTQF